MQSYRTLLHNACHSGNIDLVKYLISLNQIDLNSKDVFLLFLILFLLNILFILFKNFKLIKFLHFKF